MEALVAVDPMGAQIPKDTIGANTVRDIRVVNVDSDLATIGEGGDAFMVPYTGGSRRRAREAESRRFVGQPNQKRIKP